MSTQARNIATAQTIAAGLRLLLEYGEREGAPLDALAPLRTVEAQIMSALPPWEPEIPETPATWGRVAAGDQAQAPNGEWYKVDAVARIGREVRAHLIVGDRRVPTTQDAGTAVTVRRGPEGRAVDVFAAAGMTLERV